MSIAIGPMVLQPGNISVCVARFEDVDDLELIEEVMTFENLTSAQLAADIARSTVLRPGDIAYVRSTATSFPGRWRVKVVAEQAAAPADSNCLYVFNADRTNDASPIVAFFRTDEGYLAVVWDFFVWLEGQTHEVVRSDELGAVIAAVRDLICERAEIDGEAQLTVGDLPTAGSFFPVLTTTATVSA
jgi:hypothetical protein